MDYGDSNSPVGLSESDIGEDVDNDPAIPSSASSNMSGRQKNLVMGSAATASSLQQSLSNRPRRSASLSEGIGMFCFFPVENHN